MEKLDLKPCPFCGSNAFMSWEVVDSVPRCMICCESPKCAASLYEPVVYEQRIVIEQSAVDLWNRRTPEVKP